MIFDYLPELARIDGIKYCCSAFFLVTAIQFPAIGIQSARYCSKELISYSGNTTHLKAFVNKGLLPIRQNDKEQLTRCKRMDFVYLVIVAAKRVQLTAKHVCKIGRRSLLSFMF